MQVMQEMWVQFLGQEEPLEEEIAIHSSILDWEIPWTEEPSGLQSMGSHGVRYDLVTEHARRQDAQKSVRFGCSRCNILFS